LSTITNNFKGVKGKNWAFYPSVALYNRVLPFQGVKP
jgi:hypothetical protein